MYFNKLYCFFVYMKNMFIRVGCHEDDMLMKNKTPDSVIKWYKYSQQIPYRDHNQ